MAAAAVPAISLGAQYFMNRGANKKISTAMDTSRTGLQGSATDLSGFGDKLGDKAGGFLGDAQKTFGAAGNSLNQSANYFSPMLRGNRAAIDANLAPERAGITDTYRGAGKALEGMRGGTGDLARAELNRDRAGKLALLPSQARSGAAGAMMQVAGQQAQTGAAQAGTGANLFGQATAAKGGAGGAYSSLFQGANRQNEVQKQYANQSGGAIGSMIFDAMKSGGKKAGKSPSLGASGPWDQVGVG